MLTGRGPPCVCMCVGWWVGGCARVRVQVPISYMLDPSLFEWRDVRLDVETEGRITSGLSVADWTGQSGRPRNCRVLLKVGRRPQTKLCP